MKNTTLILITCLSFIYKTNEAQTLIPSAVDTLIRHHFADTNFMILDVCRPEAYASAHIQNAYPFYVYQTDFSTNIDTLDKHKTYLLHCTSGSMSATAITIMSPKGFTHLYEIQGGITNWKSNKFAVTTNTKQSKIRIISATDFNTAIQNEANKIIIDLRDSISFASKHIKNAVQKSRTQGALLSLLPDKTKTYLIYGERIAKTDSTQLFELYQAGYEEVYFLKDGFTSWEDAKLPIFSSESINNLDQPTSTALFSISDQQISFQNIRDADTYILFNIQGTVLDAGHCSENISLVNLVKGLYFIQINNNQKINTFRFIK